MLLLLSQVPSFVSQFSWRAKNLKLIRTCSYGPKRRHLLILAGGIFSFSFFLKLASVPRSPTTRRTTEIIPAQSLCPQALYQFLVLAYTLLLRSSCSQVYTTVKMVIFFHLVYTISLLPIGLCEDILLFPPFMNVRVFQIASTYMYLVAQNHHPITQRVNWKSVEKRSL